MSFTSSRPILTSAALAALATLAIVPSSASAAPSLVLDINPSDSSLPSPGATSYSPRFASAGGKLFFVADDGARGVELWKN